MREVISKQAGSGLILHIDEYVYNNFFNYDIHKLIMMQKAGGLWEALGLETCTNRFFIFWFTGSFRETINSFL